MIIIKVLVLAHLFVMSNQHFSNLDCKYIVRLCHIHHFQSSCS